MILTSAPRAHTRYPCNIQHTDLALKHIFWLQWPVKMPKSNYVHTIQTPLSNAWHRKHMIRATHVQSGYSHQLLLLHRCWGNFILATIYAYTTVVYLLHFPTTLRDCTLQNITSTTCTTELQLSHRQSSYHPPSRATAGLETGRLHHTEQYCIYCVTRVESSMSSKLSCKIKTCILNNAHPNHQ